MTYTVTRAAVLAATTFLTLPSLAHDALAHEPVRRTELFRPGLDMAEATMPDADAAAAMEVPAPRSVIALLHPYPLPLGAV